MNYAIQDASDVTLFKKNSDNTTTPALFSDYANVSSLEFSSDRVFAKSKGVNKVAFDTNKSGTFKIDFEVFEFKWLSILLGATENTGVSKELAKREVLSVTGNTVTVASTPKAGSVAVFTVDADNRSHLAEITVDGVTVADVDLTTAALTDGTKVVVYYLLDQAGSTSFVIDNTKYADAYKIVGDTMLRSELGVDQVVQFQINNCRPQGNFSINFSATDIATLSATFDLLADENGSIIEFIYEN